MMNLPCPTPFGFNPSFFNGFLPSFSPFNSTPSVWPTPGFNPAFNAGFVPSFTGGFNGLPTGAFPGVQSYIAPFSSPFASNFITPFNQISPFFNAWSGQSPVNTGSFIGLNGAVPAPINCAPGFNPFNGWTTPFNGYGWNTPSYGSFPGYQGIPSNSGYYGAVPSYNAATPGYVSAVSPTVNGAPVAGFSNAHVNPSTFNGYNSSIPSNGYSTPFSNSTPYSPFGVNAGAVCAHAA